MVAAAASAPSQKHPDWRVSFSDWLELQVTKPHASNADVDFCSKMAALTAVVQEAELSKSLILSKKRIVMKTPRRFRLLDNSVLLFISLATLVQCALADGKTLVLLDNLNIKDTHSIFFRSLAGLCRAWFCYLIFVWSRKKIIYFCWEY